MLVALNVSAGTRLGGCLENNDHAPCLWGVRQVEGRYPKARRRHFIVDNGGAHLAADTPRSFARRPRLRALYTPAHASWLKHAELWLRAVTDQYLDRFDAESRPHLLEPLTASWREYNHRFAHPFEWSWTRRDMYAWAEKKGYVICSKTYATVH